VSWGRVRHRVAQFFRTLLAPLRPVPLTEAAAQLSPPLLALFRRMSRAEQQHGIAVCRALQAQGYADPELLAAALLHDVGKTVASPRLWERVVVVLAEWLLPALAARWREGAPRGWRRGFVIRHQHPAWGADLAAQAGASPRTVAWIRHHHDAPGDDRLLAALQTMDEM